MYSNASLGDNGCMNRDVVGTQAVLDKVMAAVEA